MEKVEDNVNPQSVKTLLITPDQLRQVADRMDQEARRVTVRGENVIYQLTPRIVLVFKPEKKE